MGMVRFLLPPRLDEELRRELEHACMAGGPDNMPWPSEVRIDSKQLTLRRSVDESGALVVPWDIFGSGRLMGTTGTLMERPAPYHLAVELARGKVNQLRCQAEEWRAGGLQVPASLEELIQEAGVAFARTATQPAAEAAAQQAQAALTAAYMAAEELARAYMDQVFQIRQQRQPRLPTSLGSRLYAPLPTDETKKELVTSFNSVTLPLAWKEIEHTEGGRLDWEPQDALLEWAIANGLRVSAGPLIDFSPARLPDWLWLWERDLSSLAGFMCQFVEHAVKRYKDRIRRWQLTAASNFTSILGLSEDELLWLTVRVAETARQVDPSLELVTGIAQPWGEHMALEDRIHSPFIFADTLIRAGMNLAALDLEVVIGVEPRGSYCRDLLEFSRLLDLYALLGAPLQVTLGYPSATSADPRSDSDQHVSSGIWKTGFTPEGQAEWVSDFAKLALCKPFVEAVYWVHLRDAVPHQFPHSGLFDSVGNEKPALQRLRALKDKYLMTNVK